MTLLTRLRTIGWAVVEAAFLLIVLCILLNIILGGETDSFIASVATDPLNSANACHVADVVHPAAIARVAAKNQKYAAPCQMSWNPVFHFAGAIAEITTPRRWAA